MSHCACYTGKYDISKGGRPCIDAGVFLMFCATKAPRHEDKKERAEVSFKVDCRRKIISPF